jgi:hypothetical protein
MPRKNKKKRVENIKIINLGNKKRNTIISKGGWK